MRPLKFILHGDTQRQAACKRCDLCGSEFFKDKRYSWKYFESQKFCSKTCSAKHGAALSKARAGDKADRFWRGVLERDFSKCWNWQGFIDEAGYGISNWDGKNIRGHVLSLELSGRPVPAGMHGCHTCDNKSCVNPCHLYVGTPAQNARDAVLSGSHAKKLDVARVLKIRASNSTAKALASEYGVTEAMIYQIRSRKKWRHA